MYLIFKNKKLKMKWSRKEKEKLDEWKEGL